LALQANENLYVSSLQKGLGKIQRNIPLINPLNFKKSISKRFKTKKQKRKRHLSKNFRGKVIDGEHEQYILTAGMMLGIRCSLGHSKNEAPNRLKLDDFSYAEKAVFPPSGNPDGPHPTPPHKLAHTFKMKTYAPMVFRRLRDFFGIDPDSYNHSVCGAANYLEFFSNSKSGQYFFFSHDGRYMIKTQTSEETKFLNRILPYYYKHITENPDTMLVRFLGLHRVKMYHLRRKVHFLIMASVFDTPQEINVMYDLKGSLVGRRATAEERAKGGVLKDLDLIEDGVQMKLGSKREAFLAQIRRDTAFLAEHNIMDYSLLVGIHDRSRRTEAQEQISPDTTPSIVSPRPASSTNVLEYGTRSVSFIANQNHSRSNTPFRRSASTVSNVSRSTDEGKRISNDSAEQGLRIAELGAQRRPFSENYDEVMKKSIAEEGEQRRPFSESYDQVMLRHSSLDNDPFGSSEECPVESMVFEPTRCLPDDTASLKPRASSDPSFTEAIQSAASSTSQVHRVSQSFMSEEVDEEDDFSDVDSDDGDSDVDHIDVDPLTASKSPQLDAVSMEEIQAALNEEGARITKMIRDVSATSAAKIFQRSTSGSAGSSDGAVLKRSSDQSSQSNNLVAIGSQRCSKHPWTSRRDGGINGRDADGRTTMIYYTGIIDILQQYSASKRVENVVKGFKHDRRQISAVDSTTYANRFVEFLEKHIV